MSAVPGKLELMEDVLVKSLLVKSLFAESLGNTNRPKRAHGVKLSLSTRRKNESTRWVWLVVGGGVVEGREGVVVMFFSCISN